METLSSIIINIFSSILYDKANGWKDKKSIEKFQKELLECVKEFEQKHDGSIVTRGVFYTYLQNYDVIRRIFCYVIDTKEKAKDEDVFISEVSGQFIENAKEQGIMLSIEDRHIQQEFFETILNKSKTFLYEQMEQGQRAIFYVLMQNQLTLEEIKESFVLNQSELVEVKRMLRGMQKSPDSTKYSQEWFIKQNREQICNLGNRYLPDLNISLEISRIFDALDRNERFTQRFRKQIGEYLKAVEAVVGKECQQQISIIRKYAEEYLESDRLYFDVEAVVNQTMDIQKFLEKEKEVLLGELTRMGNGRKEPVKREKNEKLQKKFYRTQDALGQGEKFREYLYGKEVTVANRGCLLIRGEGGIGKSHLLADTILKRSKEGRKSLLFLGQHFGAGTIPMERMMRLLGIEKEFEDFLAQMNEIGQQEKSRVVFFIDALNEGDGKKIWNEFLPGILEKRKSYPWISFVMTIRSEYEQVLYKNNSLQSELVVITHAGFANVKGEALRQYFRHYNVRYMELPFDNPEFDNPLFVRLFCEAYRGKEVDFSKLQMKDAYENYLIEMNRRVSDACGVNERYKLVQETIGRIVRYKYERNDGNNFVSLREIGEILLDIEGRYHCKADLLGALLSEGVLTQNLDSDGEEYIYITYERLEEYLYAEYLCEELRTKSHEDFYARHMEVLQNQGILVSLAVALVKNRKMEIFELCDGSSVLVKRAFIESLKWRDSTQIYSKTEKYIEETIFKDRERIPEFFEMLVAVSMKRNYKYNADRTVHWMLRFPMPERDAIFVPLYDRIMEKDENAIQRILDWCLMERKETDMSEESYRLTASMLCMFLISPNRFLRDKTTKALVQLLKGHIPVVVELLEQFADVDDPYLLERLYAVAFGCAVSENEITILKTLALTVYQKIFDKDMVYPNILLRDYAKNIIDYAFYRGCNLTEIKRKKYLPPYCSVMPDVPTESEMQAIYAKKSTEEAYGWSSIIRSMQVEYTRDGRTQWYGDFGRYTFQSYFSAWKELSPNDLQDIALKKISDMGYDDRKHGAYDRRRGTGRASSNRRERIGKKYQWIALFELAAQVSDHYKMEIYMDCHGEKGEVYCSGSFEPHIRDIDPTISVLKEENEKNQKIHDEIYRMPQMVAVEWLKQETELPDMDRMVQLDWNGQNFLLLNGWYIWTEEETIGKNPYELPQKDMWAQINSYIVKKENLDQFLGALEHEDFMGRWTSEPNENYVLYNKEYYWSDGYHFFQNPYYCGEEWVTLDKYGEKHMNLPKVLVPTVHYMTERSGDALYKGDGSSWYKPSRELFEGMQMRYGKENTVLRDDNGKIVAFDSSELLGENIGFFVDKEILLDFLQGKGYAIFWTLLAEKRMIGGERFSGQADPMPHASGVFCMDEAERLQGKVKWYEE